MSLNPRMAQWSGKRVWLVGASSGIGRATASALHAQGAAVIVSARNAGSLQEFRRNLDDLYNIVSKCVFDVFLTSNLQ